MGKRNDFQNEFGDFTEEEDSYGGEEYYDEEEEEEDSIVKSVSEVTYDLDCINNQQKTPKKIMSDK